MAELSTEEELFTRARLAEELTAELAAEERKRVAFERRFAEELASQAARIRDVIERRFADLGEPVPAEFGSTPEALDAREWLQMRSSTRAPSGAARTLAPAHGVAVLVLPDAADDYIDLLIPSFRCEAALELAQWMRLRRELREHLAERAFVIALCRGCGWRGTEHPYEHRFDRASVREARVAASIDAYLHQRSSTEIP